MNDPYSYLDEKRIPHVKGCEKTAAELAELYGADVEKAVTAARLHDITKRLTDAEQLKMCEEFGIILDNSQREMPKLLHAVTGAELARRDFGAGDDICEAIRWHTTGKPAMSVLEKIIYLADYIEPTRDFEGAEKLRALAYEDLDRAMALGLGMSLEEVRQRGQDPYIDTKEAYRYYADK